ncbi:MAG TPA: long-chain fatty acid--CoA ligase, partial [Bacteroidota bacterium]|nr:long-chain fatty acid--CoA ligase [Bacteroidota bacterium]
MKYRGEKRPMLMHKSQGKYQGISFAEVQSSVQKFSTGLAVLGVRRGDHVAIISENRPEWVIGDFAVMHLGAVTISIFPTLTPKQIEFILNDSGTTMVIVSNQFQLGKVLKISENVPSLQKIITMVDNEMQNDKRVLTFNQVVSMGENNLSTYAGLLEDELRKTKPEDLLTLIYTSGTTGDPKGVMLTHSNMVSNIKAALECVPFGDQDLLLSFLPLSHSFERMAGYYTAIASGATVAYAESVETVRDNLLEVRPTVMAAVPRLFERIYMRVQKQIEAMPPLRRKIFDWAIETGKTYARARRTGTDSIILNLKHRIADKLVYSKLKERTGGKIRFFVSGGAALAKEFGEFFEAVGMQIIEGYGLTETSPVISVNRLNDYKFGTVGKPIPGVKVKIAEDGEILVQGPNVMKGYWNNKRATDEVIDQLGWFHTGDIGMFDDDGFLVITDRKKNIFVSSGGKNIAPQPIENLLLQSKFIDQCILVGDGRMFLTALIVPYIDVLKEYAHLNDIKYSDENDLVKSEGIYQAIENDINKLQVDLASYERVRKFTLLKKPFTIENGELTPTLKIRRKVVEEKFKASVEKMYEMRS